MRPTIQESGGARPQRTAGGLLHDTSSVREGPSQLEAFSVVLDGHCAFNLDELKRRQRVITMIASRLGAYRHSAAGATND